MAVKRVTTETRVSDLSGVESADVTPVKFSWDGKAYKLDLTAAELAEFDGLMARYVQAAVDARTSGNAGTEDDGAQIRQWGRDHGWDVSDRGKLSASLKAAFYNAQTDDEPESESKGSKAKAGK